MANPDTRQTLIKIIHVARRELNMDEATYRTMLKTAGKAESTSKMDVPALKAVLEQAKRAGFQVRSTKPDRRQDTSPQARKVRALWLLLHHLGAVRDPSERALAGYVKRIGKVDDMHWASAPSMLALIESLKKWAMRGYLPAAVAALKVEVTQLHEAHGLTQEQMDAVTNARFCLNKGEGFDYIWWAWEWLMKACGHTLPGDIGAARPEVIRG